MTLQKFLDDLAARTPTPGGGSAAALGGAIGAALGNMAAAYTAGNEKFKDAEPRVLVLIERLTALRKLFMDLLKQDVEAYSAYAAARALPKTSPDEKKARSKALSAAREQATLVPERIVAESLEGLQVVEQLGTLANPNLAGDVAVAAYFLEAAARGAAMQVAANCSAADAQGRNEIRRSAVQQIVAQCQAARERIDEQVRGLLKDG